jgi:hypothetical protein
MEYTTMAMSCQERKAAQRSRPDGYAKSRESGWKCQGIETFSYVAFLEMIVAQKSQCSICGCGIDASSHLDHDHKTGAVRSVLCQRCNLLLGKYEVSGSVLLRNAASYLESFQERMN